MYRAHLVRILMDMIFENYHRSRSLPHVVGEDCQARPDSRGCRALCQHSSQAKLAFEHADRGLYATAKPLQLPKPFLSLIPLFFSAQATHFWDANFLNAGLAKLQHVLGTVVAPIGGKFFRLYAQTGFSLAHYRKQLCSVTGIAPVNLIVNNDSRAILHQLQGAPKLNRLVQFPFADGPRFRIVERNDPLGYRFISLKLLLGLAHNGLRQFNLLKKLLLELGRLLRYRTLKRLESLAAVLHGLFGKLGHFLKYFSSLRFTFFGVGLGRLTPAEKGSLGCPYVAGDLSSQSGCRSGKRLDRLMNDSHIVRIADMSLKGSRVDPYPPRLDRSSLQQLLDQMFIQSAYPIFTKSLIELNQGRRIRDLIHQGKMAEIPPRQPLPDFSLHFFVAQPPAKLQVHHPKVDPYRSAWTAQTWIEGLFKRFQHSHIGQKLIDLLQFFVQLIERRVDKTVTKTHLLRYGCAHDLFMYTIALFEPKKIVTFSVTTS